MTKKEIICSTCLGYHTCFPITHPMRKENIIICVESCAAYNKPKINKPTLTIYSPPLLVYLKTELLQRKISFSCLHDNIIFTNKKDFKKANKIIKILTGKITR